MYEERLKAKFYSRDDISELNKIYVERFFKGYNCTKSSEGKFYSWLPYVLTQTKDIMQTMNNETELIDIFDKLHSKLKPSGYKTSLDVCRTFCKRLNKGVLPETFKMVKHLTKSEKQQLKRINKKDYHTFSWEDGLKICEHTNSLQLKAMILCQLDGGLRPAELEALNYGDAERDGKFIILHVKESKTAKPRDVVLYKSAPALNRWLQLHPIKKDNDSLWIMESCSQSSSYKAGDHNLRYKYHAIKQVLRRLAMKAGFKNGASLYMMRHSAVSLAKQDMMSVEIAAEKFGHDINYYVNTYGKLTDKQKIDRFKAHYGESTENNQEKPKSILCNVCDTINEPEKEFCEKCGNALSLIVALKHDKTKQLEKQLKAMQNQQEQMQKILAVIVDSGADASKIRAEFEKMKEEKRK